MNERFWELAKRADVLIDYGDDITVGRYSIGGSTEKMKKFAELIVRECIQQGNTLANHYINTQSEQDQVMLLASIADYSNEIRKHFGVEE